MTPNEKGIGRPFSGDGLKSKELRVRMSESELSELDDLASQMQSNRSGVIRKGIALVREWLSKKK